MKFIIALIALTLMAPAARAADEGLYDPVAPAGSAFIRFINTSDAAQEPIINGKTYKSVAAGAVGPYVPVKAGVIETSFGPVTLTEGGWYTGGGAAILMDEAASDPLKAMIAFYNFSAQDDLSLKTMDGKIAVIESIATGKSGYRAINGVPVEMAVFSGDKKVTDIGAIILTRGQAMTIVMTDKGAQAIAATTDTTQ